MSTRNPMQDPQPGDRLHDYHFGYCSVERVDGDDVTVLWPNVRSSGRPKTETYSLKQWRDHWRPAEFRLKGAGNPIGYVVSLGGAS